MPKSKKISPPSEPLEIPKSGVTIRMYDCGFGDCFLLIFHAQDGSPRYMLIDCGVHHRYEGREERMQKIAKDIARVTGNHLHIVAVTHEHTDHLYGFKYARETFSNMTIDDLWLAWTENPKDPDAIKLKGSIKKGVAELTSAVNRLAPMDAKKADTLRGILEFEVADIGLGAKASELDFLRERSQKKLQKITDYRSPGEATLTIPDVKGVKVYVLGPPRNPEYIKTVERESEMYPEFAAFMAALKGSPSSASKEDELIVRRSCPFDKRYDLTIEGVKTDPDYGDFFKTYYGFAEGDKQGAEWRRIDDNWLGPADELALKINNLTNNTSLVLAFELTESQPHKVLLFVGDAQVGNWLSWFEKDTVKVDTEDLLKRTVFYKVGHHGSRNATLYKKGLEIMNDDKLVAMIPVDQAWAKKEMNWEHPAEKLLEHLEEKTKNRVLRTDKISSMPDILQKPDAMEENEWRAFLEKQVKWDKTGKLWIQYTVA